MAKSKGYIFAGVNSAGINAFFIRKDVAAKIPECDLEMGYVITNVRESRNKNGNLTFVSGIDRLKLMEDEVLLDIERRNLIHIKHIVT